MKLRNRKLPAEPELEITIQNRQRSHRVSSRALESFLRKLSREMPPRRESTVGVCLVSDQAMRKANRDFRSIDRPTDVLSFPDDSEIRGEPLRHLGDILISVPTAQRQGRDAGHGLSRELKCLLLHGYLHLLGYDHESDRGLMLRLQHRLERRLLTTS